MKVWKKVLILSMCMVTLLGFNVTYASAMQENAEEKILNVYKNALLTGDISEYDILLEKNEGTDVFKGFMEWRVSLMDILDVNYSTFDYTVVKSLYEDSTITVVFNEVHEYENGAGQGSSCGLVMNVRYDADNMNKIEEISIENDEFYDYFIAEISEPQMLSQLEDDFSMEQKLENLKNELISLKEEMDESTENQVAREQIAQPSLLATTYTYSGNRGASYANKYYSSANSYFYTATGRDCTNFVSQCIWAGYGGWNTSMSNSTMQSNITNNVRMTSTWFAGSGGGAPAWENVDELWNYVVGNTGTGPKAVGYNNGGYYTDLLPIDIAVGDVLQRGSDGSDYSHSVYVVSVPGGSNPSYSEIVIAQHSGNMKRTVTELLASGGKYLRQMQFKPNSF